MDYREDSNFIPVEDFRIAWRWTNPKWNLLPPEDLAQIQPYREEQAEYLWKEATVLLSSEKWGLSKEKFPAIQTFDDNSTSSPEEGRQWLQSLDVSEQEMILVSWRTSGTVRTRWGVLCRYWNDFLYPSSDDVVIRPAEGESWALFYFHEEIFEFGATKLAKA